MESLFVSIKRGIRRTIAPVARPIWRRLRPRITRITDVFKLSDAWHQHAPALANAAASVAAMSREQQRMKREYDAAIAQLRADIEQLRGARAAGGVRLHLGAAPRDGYTHIATGFDALPFGPGQVDEIVVEAGRLAADEQQKLLPYWMGLLKPGGTFRAVK
jgi:hypothetical protein